MMGGNLRIKQAKRRAVRWLSLAATTTLPLCAMAGWTLDNSRPIEPNTNAVVALLKSGGAVSTPSTLWIGASGSPELIVPETIEASANKIFLPVFARGSGKAAISILDSADDSQSTITIEVRSTASAGRRPWLPHLRLEGEDGLPVVLASRPTTAVLDMEPGDGPMPPTTHISATDHRGRMVLSRFYRTFELAAGSETLELPTAGDYTLTVKLVKQNPDAMPQARYRTPMPIAYGQTTAQFEPAEARAGVTTQSVVGSRVALEHLPTTATVVGIDRLRVVALGRHSLEMQRNRWPFVIAGADLADVPSTERVTAAKRRLGWQRRLGSSFAPVSVVWSDVQPTPGSFTWGSFADVMPLYRRMMVRPLLTVSGRAGWNNQYPNETTSTLAAWQRFIGEIGNNYMSVMWGLYCWDMPEQTWPDAADYVKVLLAAADGLQTKNGTKRPSSPLVAGSLQQFNPGYLEAILTTETVPRLGGVSFDMFPANKKAPPESNGFESMMKTTKQLLQNKGADRVGLWITGTGWPVGPRGVTNALQANYLVRTHVMALANGAEKITWCDLFDRPAGNSAAGIRAREGRWGLLNEHMMPRPSGVAYNVMTYALSGATSPTASRQGSALITSFNLPLQNNKWPGTVYVAWTDSPQKQQTIQLDMTRGGGVYAFDYLGAQIPTKRVAGDPADPISGTYSLTVGYEPVYIWDAGKPGSTGGS